MTDRNYYYIKISPESLKDDIVLETFSGDTFGVYSGMSNILSGGTNGSSLLTGLTIPLLFTQKYDDIGYYSEFDGFILQKDVVVNFLYSGTTILPYTIYLYNSSDSLKKFLELSDYVIDWGDGFTENITLTSTTISHSYPNQPETYTIKLKQSNLWGNTEISKTIHLPNTGLTINNLNGTITFTPMSGSWSGMPLSYDFIFTGDSVNTVNGQTSDNFLSVPFTVTGYTSSQLKELRKYGQNQYQVGVIIQTKDIDYGSIDLITPEFTAYTINDTQYYDYKDGSTLYFVQSSGLTSDMLVAQPITKEEILMGVVNPTEIQSEIFIERGKNSGFEGLQRLGEVDNIGDLVSYGYRFFKINETT